MAFWSEDIVYSWIRKRYIAIKAKQIERIKGIPNTVPTINPNSAIIAMKGHPQAWGLMIFTLSITPIEVLLFHKFNSLSKNSKN